LYLEDPDPGLFLLFEAVLLSCLAFFWTASSSAVNSFGGGFGGKGFGEMSLSESSSSSIGNATSLSESNTRIVIDIRKYNRRENDWR
jgi:hypothetical protein